MTKLKDKISQCRLIFLLAVSLFAMPSFADISVKVGESATLKCTATAPDNGWITHVFFELSSQNYSEYVALQYNSTDQFATVYGLKPNSGVTVVVTYYYSYRGSYDNKIHVGHGSYRETVTVLGGGNATGITITPSSPVIKVGESVNLKVELQPSNAVSAWEWGVAEGISSRPSTYQISGSGNTITVKALKEMTIYIIAKTENGKTATCVVKAKATSDENNIPPAGISLIADKTQINVGEKISLGFLLSPEGSSSAIAWKSSNENVLTVTNTGEATGVSGGKAIVTATTSNGISSSVEIEVLPSAETIYLPQSIDVYYGYNRKIDPQISPSNASPKLTWSSSNSWIAYVGVNTSRIYAQCVEGTVELTAKTDNGLEKSCQVYVVPLPDSESFLNADDRIARIQNMVVRCLPINNQ